MIGGLKGHIELRRQPLLGYFGGARSFTATSNSTKQETKRCTHESAEHGTKGGLAAPTQAMTRHALHELIRCN